MMKSLKTVGLSRLAFYMALSGWVIFAVYVLLLMESESLGKSLIKEFLSVEQEGIRFRALVFFGPLITTVLAYILHERGKAEKNLIYINRALRTVRESTQAVVHAGDEKHLLDDVCRTIVGLGGYRMAWAGYAEHKDGKPVRPVASAGFDEGYIESLHVTWADDEHGQGCTGAAIRTGAPSVIKDIRREERARPWRKEALKRGYASSVALPMFDEGRPLGAITIFSSVPDAFDEEETDLLMELANDLAFGIKSLRMREKRRLAEEKVKLHLGQLKALRAIDMAISASLDLRLTLEVLLEHVVSTLDSDAACVLLLNPHTMLLEHAAGKGFRDRRIESVRLRLGESYAGRVAMERKPLAVSDISMPEGALPFRGGYDFPRSKLAEEEGFRAYCGMPLIAKGRVLGVIEVFHRTPFRHDPGWSEFLEAIAGQAAIAIDNASLFDDLRRSHEELVMAYDTTIEGWSKALDYRDKETENHSQRVTEMTLRIARSLGLPEAEIVHMRRGALLHDIGKLGVPDRILLKPDRLTEDEWKVMRSHPEFAYRLLFPITYLRPALDIPYCHHEKWDGTGYPRGLKGEEIPVAARIFAVADVWDALSSDRPYRPAWPREKVAEHVRALSGTHFDPEVVRKFLSMDWFEEHPAVRAEG